MSGLYWSNIGDFIGRMDKKMEPTIIYWGYIYVYRLCCDCALLKKEPPPRFPRRMTICSVGTSKRGTPSFCKTTVLECTEIIYYNILQFSFILEYLRELSGALFQCAVSPDCVDPDPRLHASGWTS